MYLHKSTASVTFQRSSTWTLITMPLTIKSLYQLSSHSSINNKSNSNENELATFSFEQSAVEVL